MIDDVSRCEEYNGINDQRNDDFAFFVQMIDKVYNPPGE
jgi:hypothetical protein